MLIDKSFKILVSVILIMLTCCLLLHFEMPNDSKQIVLKFASWGSKSEVDILKPIIEDFEKENPDVKIDFMHIPQNYFQKIHLLFASNTAPDVIFMNNLYLPIYANAGVLEDLSSMALDVNSFYKQALDALSWEGKLYAVPRDVSNLVIFYNKDLFRKAHIPFPETNWTFAEFLDIARKLTKSPHQFGISFEEDLMFYLPYLMSEGGGILSDDLSKEIIKEEASQKAIKFYADLRKKHHVAPLKSESASATMAQLFLQQKIAMHLTGRWLVPKYLEEANFDWDIISFPRGSVGSVVPLDASGWAIAKSSKNKEVALKFILYLSSEDCLKRFARSGLIVPAKPRAASVIVNQNKPQNAQIFLDVVEKSKPTPVSLDYNRLNDRMKTYTEFIFN